MDSPHLIGEKLLDMKAKTGWSWVRLTSELERVMGELSLSHTTVFRIRRLAFELARQDPGQDAPEPSRRHVRQ